MVCSEVYSNLANGLMVSPDRPGTSGYGGKPSSMLVESIELVHRSRLRALYSHFVIAAIALAIGWSEPGRLSNFVLVGILILYAIGAIVATRWYNAQSPSDALARRWSMVMYVQVALLALLYNAIFMNLARLGVSHAMNYLLLILALYCAGGAATYAYLKGLAVVFVIFAIAPQIVYHLASGSEGALLIAFVLTVFLIFMSSTSMTLHREAVQRLHLTRELSAAKEYAERLARTDALTGLFNRRALLEIGAVLFAGTARDGRPLSVVMLDIDHFKDINDRHGHRAGDAALIAIADALRSVGRVSDVVGRLGGEEFAIVLPNTGAAEATRFAERIRHAIRSGTVGFSGTRVTLTASLGVAERAREDRSIDSLIHRADAALYRAKAQGRDRTVTE